MMKVPCLKLEALALTTTLRNCKGCGCLTVALPLKKEAGGDDRKLRPKICPASTSPSSHSPYNLNNTICYKQYVEEEEENENKNKNETNEEQHRNPNAQTEGTQRFRAGKRDTPGKKSKGVCCGQKAV